MRIFHTARLPLAAAMMSAIGFVAWQAGAEHGQGQDDHERGDKGHHERRGGEHRDGGAEHGHREGHRMWNHDGGANDDDEDDAGSVNITRTPEQEARHAQMVSREREKLKEWSHKRKRHLTMVERQAMGTHWRHVIRLERIREIAEQEKDTTTLKKVDELLDRENKKFDTRLVKLASEEVGEKSGSSTSDGGAR